MSFVKHMNWINPTTRLRGQAVSLIPLEEEHFEALNTLAEDPRIFEFIPADMSTKEKRLGYFYNALSEREKQTQFPFVILNNADNTIIGSTRLMDIHPEHRKLEIGWTWLHPDYWASGINTECKLLLLQFCFEALKAIRVQLKTDENNRRSRKAIQKIGAVFEGILRQDYIRDNGTVRNSVFFSILASEWPEKKVQLEKLIHDKSQHT